MGLKEVCILSFVKDIGFLEENLDFRPSYKLERKENRKNTIVFSYRAF